MAGRKNNTVVVLERVKTLFRDSGHSIYQKEVTCKVSTPIMIGRAIPATATSPSLIWDRRAKTCECRQTRGCA